MNINSTKAEAESFLDINWSIEEGKFSAWMKQNNALYINNLSGSVNVNESIFFLNDATESTCKEVTDDNGNRTCTVEFLFAEQGILWVWEITGTNNHVELTAVLKNCSKKSITVSNWNVLHAQVDTGKIIDLGKTPEQIRFFKWRGWQTQVECFTKPMSTHISDTLCHLFDPSSGATLLSSFVTITRMTTSHSLRYTEESGITEYAANCSFGEHRIDAGKELKSETLRISYHRDPYIALESWADKVNKTYQPSFEGTLAVGWSGGAWIDAFTCKDESWSKILLGNAEAIRKRLNGFEINSVSGGTHKILKGGLPGNWLTFEEPKHKESYRELFEKLEGMGFSLKLWFSPFWFFGEAEEILEENRENLLKDKDGNLIIDKRTWEFDRNHNNPDDKPNLTQYYLDGTHPKTKEYITKIFKAYRELGARAYMLDFLKIKPEAKLYDDTLLPTEAGRKILEVIRDAAGFDTHIQTAVASTPGFIGCVNAARVGRDYGEGRPMYPFHNWRNATYCMHDDHFSNTRFFLQNAMASWFTNKKVYVNDLNALTIDKPVPLEHARISTTMFGLSGDSPMNLNDDIRTIDSERLRMLKMCLPRTKGVPVPVDLFDNVAPDNYCRIIKKSIEREWDSYIVTAIFNLDDKPYDTDLDFAKLGLPEDESFRIYDFWNEEYVGTYKGSYSHIVPQNSCRLFRISPAHQHPWLLSTDMHVEQGNAEIESLEWDETTKTLKGIVVRPAGEIGNLFFLVPRQLKLINHEKACLMKEVIDMQTVLRLPIEFESDKETFELRFEVMDTQFVSRYGWLPYATEEEWSKYVEENKDPASNRVIGDHSPVLKIK